MFSRMVVSVLRGRRATQASGRFLMTSSPRYSSEIPRATHKVNNLEKKFLVWTGKYKSTDEVPVFVAQDVMERARNRMRIRVSNIMIALTVLACLGVVIAGKRARDRGESLQQQNLDWHRQLKEEAMQKRSQ